MLIRDRVAGAMAAGQERLVRAFTELDGGASFATDRWVHAGGGGGTARILEDGDVFERAGVNVSAVTGAAVPESVAAAHPEARGRPFFATGISMVLHPRSPYVPAFHCNFRYFEVDDLWWFGGGADMTPAYGFAVDADRFHRVLRAYCERHGVVAYPEAKTACDRYFEVHHRGELRGYGGIFFDLLTAPDPGGRERILRFVRDGIDTVVAAYAPVVRRRMCQPYGPAERRWQLERRGRYVEFNLLHDRGTAFGLQTGGSAEAILMSMPPVASWRYDSAPAATSPEGQTLALLSPPRSRRPRRRLRLGTRASRLATTQSGAFGALLRDATGRDVELVEVTTQGDVSAEPLDRMGATGVFVTALREALLDGRIDLAVHSYKDLPTAAVPGLAVGAVPPREDPRDALVARGGAALATLPAGARVGTGSPRRAAQLRALGLPLLVVPIRGNVDTRVRLVERGAVDAIVVARAGLARLGRLDLVTETLPTDVLLPAPAQGALAVECRADDAELLALLGALDHAPSRAVVEAERALLATLEGGCSAPVAALARRVDDGLALEAAVAPPDGSRLLRMSASGSLAEPARLGEELAAALLDAGAGALVRAARRLDER